MKAIFSTFSTFIICLMLSFSAQALTLQEAKQAGLVGERTNGYLGMIKQDAEAKKLILTVNKKRQAKYKQLATQHNISVEAVALRAGKKAISLTPKGQFVEVKPGQWKRK